MDNLKEESNLPEEMQIKIQTLTNAFPLAIKRSASVQDLKEKINETFNIPITKQRLIFHGKLLQDAEKLKFYKVLDDSVIHMVANVHNGSSAINEENTNNTQVPNTTNNESTEPRLSYEDIVPAFIEFPVIRRGGPHRRRRAPHYDISECFESMHQNISTIQNLMNCRVKFDEQQVLQNRTITPYDFNRSKFEVGQWVDVKDTIDQWLEAQVMQVRNNQIYVHYNGWGNRWDEWIDFHSPRIAAFKTYTFQSPSSGFLSPYPSVPCDANIEPQHRTIDTFYYLEKSANNMTEILRSIDYMSKLRKKNLSRNNEVREIITKEEKDKKLIKKDDFVESKEKENQSKINSSNMVSSNNTINVNDYDIMFNATQLVPLLDRTGRLLCDISLQLSHLILNPNLYPQLLLGYNQNIDISDTLSCTSGYSMYTNEGSSISGMTSHHLEQSFIQGIRGNILNSNQMIHNYNLTNNPNNTTNQQNQTQVNSSNYNVSSSSYELPFIQRIVNTNHNTTMNLISNNNDNIPKINLQVPSMMTHNESMMHSGYGNIHEPNIDIYVHTVVTPTPTNNINSTQTTVNNPDTNILTNNTSNTTNSTINTASIQSVLNPSNLNSLFNRRNTTNTRTSSSEHDVINRNAETSMVNNNQTGTTNIGSNNQEMVNNLLGNLMNLIGGSSHNRRGSTGSDTSNTSSRLNTSYNTIPNVNTLSQNLNVAHNSLNTGTQTNTAINSLINRNQVVQSARSNNNSTNSILRDSSSQTELTLNLLSLNKDNVFSENMMEISSNKSDKNVSLKNKHTISYKSVSEISEFEEYDNEEPSDFVIRTKKPDKANKQTGKLNESVHSSNSHISKDIFEDKEESETNSVKKGNNEKKSDI